MTAEDALDRIDRSIQALTQATEGLTALRLDFRVAEEDRQRETRRFHVMALLFGVLLLGVLAVGIGNRSVGTTLRNCIEPRHECSDRLTVQQLYSVRQIVDSDSNGVADTEEIKALLEHRTPTTLPKLPPIPPVPKRGPDWGLVVMGVLLAVGVGALGQWLYIHWRLRRWEEAAEHERRERL